jgi:hypothetical protein
MRGKQLSRLHADKSWIFIDPLGTGSLGCQYINRFSYCSAAILAAALI